MRALMGARELKADKLRRVERYPKHLAHSSSALEASFAHIDVGAMRTFLTKFSSFKTRYFRSQTGRESQLFLLDHLKTVRPRPASLPPPPLHRRPTCRLTLLALTACSHAPTPLSNEGMICADIC